MARRPVSALGPALPGLEPTAGALTPPITTTEPGGTRSRPGRSSLRAQPPGSAPGHLARKRPTDTPDAPFCGEVEAFAHVAGLGPLIGLDEAGRGPLAGPVVVAACALPWPCPLEGIDDSKKLSEDAREALFEPILRGALAASVIIVEPDVIDELNILHASLHGMRLAWEDLVARHPELHPARVVVDGKDLAPLPEGVTQHALVKGDSRSVSIAAASILAKVTRDRIMREAHLSWPVYGFDRHKGYPTVAHRAALAEHGPCPIHRRSFTLLGAARDDADDA